MTAALVERLAETGRHTGLGWCLASLKWRRSEILERIRKSKKAYTKDPYLTACLLLAHVDQQALDAIDLLVRDLEKVRDATTAPREF